MKRLSPQELEYAKGFNFFFFFVSMNKNTSSFTNLSMFYI